MKNKIIIQDWAGNILFSGDYKDPEVDRILILNRCNTCESGCKNCEDTGYSGDFEVYWDDKKDTRNVYEFINY